MGKVKPVLVKDMEHCLVCGSPHVHWHHVFFGTANRKLSDKYGFIVPLCQEHHTGDSGAHFNRDFDLHLKKMAQRHFETHYGARKEFMKIFGRSYL